MVESLKSSKHHIDVYVHFDVDSGQYDIASPPPRFRERSHIMSSKFGQNLIPTPPCQHFVWHKRPF